MGNLLAKLWSNIRQFFAGLFERLFSFFSFILQALWNAFKWLFLQLWGCIQYICQWFSGMFALILAGIGIPLVGLAAFLDLPAKVSHTVLLCLDWFGASPWATYFLTDWIALDKSIELAILFVGLEALALAVRGAMMVVRAILDIA